MTSSFNIIGVMSGTSVDGLDLCYVSFTKDFLSNYKIICSETIDYPSILKTNLINDFDEEYNPYVLPTLNISYLLTRPDMKRQAWEDMKLLRDKIREI